MAKGADSEGQGGERWDIVVERNVALPLEMESYNGPDVWPCMSPCVMDLCIWLIFYLFFLFCWEWATGQKCAKWSTGGLDLDEEAM